MKRSKNGKVKRRNIRREPDMSMFQAAIYPEEEKIQNLNTDFLFEELKKRRPDKPKIKELVTTPEQCRLPPPHTPKYLISPKKDQKSLTISPNKENMNLSTFSYLDETRETTKSVTSRDLESMESPKLLTVTCFGSPNVSLYKMNPRNIPDIKAPRYNRYLNEEQTQNLYQYNIKSNWKPRKRFQERNDKSKSYSWKYYGDTNQNLGAFTARIPMKSDPSTATRAQSAINGVRKVHVEQKKRVVHPRDLYALSIKQEDDYVRKRTYSMDYDTQIADNVIAAEDVQTFLQIDDKLIPLKASILQ